MHRKNIYCRITQAVFTTLSLLLCTQFTYASVCSFELEIDPESRTISDKSRLIISQIADLHKTNKHSDIQINAYAKLSSDRAYNIAISSGNAEFVGDELHKAGVETKYIQTQGFGQEAPEFLKNTKVSTVIVNVLDCDKTKHKQSKPECPRLSDKFAQCEFNIQAYDEVLILASKHVDDSVYTALVMNGINTDYDVLELAETLVSQMKDEAVSSELNNILERNCFDSTVTKIIHNSLSD